MRWGAAIAYYSVVSLAPLVVLAVTGLGHVVENQRAERWILDQLQLLAGPQAVEVASGVIEQTGQLELASLGGIATILLLAFAATAVFTNLQRALNGIWAVEPRSGMLRNLARSRVAAFVMVLLLGGLIVVSLVLGTVLGWIRPVIEPVERLFPLFRVADLLGSVFVLWAAVTAVFWVLPDVRISWRDVRTGAFVTAVLLVLGKLALASFLANSASASLYGTAGAIFLLLLWVYYSAMVFFLGAEFTQVWARARGREIMPEDYAVRIVTVERTPEELGKG
ncbi:MAG: YihY/virulence factor BrkB family protein, partial [Candidatus Longimicrobiales bacterium M2_2A_002]